MKREDCKQDRGKNIGWGYLEEGAALAPDAFTPSTIGRDTHTPLSGHRRSTKRAATLAEAHALEFRQSIAVNMLFIIGDYVAGMAVSVLAALAVRAVVSPGLDIVIAMLLGTAAGMVLHFIVGLILAPLLGMFQTMLPGSLIGMYGGMLFGMRDSMAAGSTTLSAAITVAAIFGVVAVAGVKLYGRVIRGPVFDMEK